MEASITYSLRAGEQNSDHYYTAVAAFADQWSARVLERYGAEIAAFREAMRAAGKKARTPAECAFEMLVLGVTLREHGRQAQQPNWVLRLERGLVDLQNRHPRREKAIKRLRGWVNGLFRRKSGPPLEPGELDSARLAAWGAKLVGWLRAQAEDTQAGRLAEWLDWFAVTGKGGEGVRMCLEMAAQFAREAPPALGAYLGNVESFLRAGGFLRRWRYDAELLGRSAPEYYLGMLGTEILNRAFAEGFAASARRVVIVPPCMRRKKDDCKAVATPLGDRCRACDPLCQVNQLTRLGKEHAFEVFTIPDDLRKFAPNGSGGPGATGIVGVACALMDWKGGWDLENFGIPGQGVLLDYAGCSYHWSKEGRVTDANLERIVRLCAK